MRHPLLSTLALLVLLLSGCAGSSDRTAPDTASQTGGIRVVSAAEGLELAQDAVVLDVRTPEEYAEGHLEGARNLPLIDDFSAAVADLPRDESYVLYCRTGNRSAEAAGIMSELGFTDVADAGGLDALAEAGGRVVP